MWLGPEQRPSEPRRSHDRLDTGGRHRSLTFMNNTSTESKTQFRPSDTDHCIRNSIDANKHITTRPITYPRPITPSVDPLPPRTSIWCANTQEAAAHGTEIARLETRVSGANGITGGMTTPPMPAGSCSASAATERYVTMSTATARPRSIAGGGGAPYGAGAGGGFADVLGGHVDGAEGALLARDLHRALVAVVVALGPRSSRPDSDRW
jgi:hypothetical protein